MNRSYPLLRVLLFGFQQSFGPSLRCALRDLPRKFPMRKKVIARPKKKISNETIAPATDLVALPKPNISNPPTMDHWLSLTQNQRTQKAAAAMLPPVSSLESQNLFLRSEYFRYLVATYRLSIGHRRGRISENMLSGELAPFILRPFDSTSSYETF